MQLSLIIMNKYINEILTEFDNELRKKKVQKTINKLITQYIKETQNRFILDEIKEIAQYFKEYKISYKINQDVLLRMTSLYGETEFISWLLKEANTKVKPDVQIQLSAPLRFAAMNNHNELLELLLTDKEIKRSKINEVNSGALGSCLYNQNAKGAILLLSQPEIDLQIEHLRDIFALKSEVYKEVMAFISEHPVKNQILKRMIQYRQELKEEIKELISNNTFKITPELKEEMKYHYEFHEIIAKKELVNKLEENMPVKNIKSKTKKI